MQLKRLGPYEIDRPLGKGGMGSVFAATDTTTGQRVAIKALTPHLAMAEGFRERFEAEIESLKILRHEGIVRLFGYGEQDSVLFYSMELVDGISLEDELKAGRRFNWREVSSIAIQLSLALKHAHDHGIVHRDIKPANILLYNEDRVKLADFGIARLFGATQLTTAGGVLGTADYMSPEQADGRPVTARCDQYSLGGVLYALLTGRPPFRARNLPQMLQLQRFASPEPVRRYAPDTPEQLERVIMQLLAKNPADRFPNTQVLARHMQAMVMALSRPAPDDFALADEHPPDIPRDVVDQHLLATEATQSESPAHGAEVSPSSDAGAKPAPAPAVASHDAATLAADVVVTNRPFGTTPAPRVLPEEATQTRAPERPAHFTTIAEEEARQRLEQQRSWITIAAQLVLLVAVLAGMGALALYFSRPPTADELYQTITSQVESEDDASLAEVSREIEEFLRRYPQDPRAAEFERYNERIALDRLERRLQREARGVGGANASLLPMELRYLHSKKMIEISPERAASMLQSLIDLYEPDVSGNNDPDNASESTTAVDQDHQRATRTAAVVQLARRQLVQLRSELAKQRAAQLDELRDRMDVAKRLVASDAQRAAAMYRAIVDLYQDEAWARDIVTDARRRLAKIAQDP